VSSQNLGPPQAQLERVLEGESRQLPWQHLTILFGLTLGAALVTQTHHYCL
jgi:hypothetical protein